MTTKTLGSLDVVLMLAVYPAIAADTQTDPAFKLGPDSAVPASRRWIDDEDYRKSTDGRPAAM